MRAGLNKSRTFIDEDYNDSIEYESYMEYILAINQKLQTISQSLAIAEGLIEEYRQQNIQLRTKNEALTNNLTYLKQKMQLVTNSSTCSIDQHEISETDIGHKVFDLRKQDQRVEQRMKMLIQQFDKSQAKIVKLTRVNQGKLEQKMHNFFQFPKTHTKHFQSKELARQIRSLKNKLQQREQQVMCLIKRNKILEEAGQSKLKQSCETTPAKIIKHSDELCIPRFHKVKNQDRYITCSTANNR